MELAGAARRKSRNENRGTIESMILITFAIRALEWMFLIGLVGSAVVVVISFVEDGNELFGKD
jgi:hypothetical protein